MALSGFLHRVSTNSSFRTANSSPDGEVPMETISRRSSDIASQRHLSEAANLGQRIQDDINSGQYECGICMDKVTRDSAIWYCMTCWNVCHHDCMQKCAAGGANRTVAPGRKWKCPSCRAVYSGPPRLVCWCATSLGVVNRNEQPPNSCGSPCFKPLSCLHRCSQNCHAGPCDPCAHDCKPRVQKTEVRILQTSLRGSTVGDRDGGVGIAVNADLERAAPRLRAAQDPISLLLNSIIKRHGVSLILTLTLMAAVILWTAVIVEPFNHKSIAENNRGVRATWAVLGITGFFITIYNVRSVTAFQKTRAEIRSQMERRLPKLTAVLGIFDCPWAILHRFLTVTWVIGPFFSAVFLPMIARLLYFQHVCDGFDTRIVLDTGGDPLTRADYRVNPIFKDLTADALPPYTMAIASNSTDKSQTSVELNYYDNPLNEILGITQTVQAPLPLRTTTIDDNRIGMTIIQTHAKDTYELNPSKLWKDKIKKVFNGWGSDEEDTIVVKIDVHESPGFYRVIYDNVLNQWLTQVDSKPQYNGTFTSDQHLIFPSLGLQVPNFADFAKSCKYEPFLKMHRGTGAPSEIEKQGKESYRYDGGDVVLRTVAFGIKQRRLEICARRRDVVTDMGVVLKGLGDKLPVVAGFLASVRYEGWKHGRQGSC